MANPQKTVNADGSATNAYTVQSIIEKSIESLSARSSTFGGLGLTPDGKENLVKTHDIGGRKLDIGNSSVVYSKVVNTGDEARFTLSLDFEGMPTHGSAPVKMGQYPEFMYDNVRLNQFDSPAYPFYGEMDQQRFANLISNMEPHYQKNIARYMGKWVDFSAIQALLMGADRGSLLTTDGGLGMQLGNAASAGDIISCKNTYVGGNSDLVDWNATRATFETNIASALNGLTDTSGDGFSLTAHEMMLDLITSELRFKEVEAFGETFRSVALIDPWLLKRILNRSGSWLTLMKDADLRGPKNSAIDREQSVIIDKVLYIPVDWLRAFRATDVTPTTKTYGAGLTQDPQTYIKSQSSHLCPVIYMGAGALLNAKSQKVYGAGTDVKKGGKVWFTPDYGKHGKGGNWSAHAKWGFKRHEPEYKTGTAGYLNNHSLVGWFYDPGPGVKFGDES